MTDAVVWLDLDERERLPVTADIAGPLVCELYQHIYDWPLTDGRLCVRVLADRPIQVAVPDDDETVYSGLARLVHSHGNGQLLVLERPGAWLQPAQMPFAAGCRAVWIADEADEACWHAGWSRGAPLWGFGQQLRIVVPSGRTDNPTAVLLALAFGHVTAGEPAILESLHEDSQGISWHLLAEGRATILGPDAFELAQVEGIEGRWQDRPGTGHAHIVWQLGDRRAWSQPRLTGGAL